MTHKIIQTLTLIILLIVLGITLFWGFLKLYPFKIIEVKSPLPILNENKQVVQGENLLYRLEYCKYMDIEGFVIRRFIDGVVYSIPTTTTNVQKGCHTIEVATVEVPEALPTGTYIIEVSVIYELTSFRKIYYMFETEEFEVIEAGENYGE